MNKLLGISKNNVKVYAHPESHLHISEDLIKEAISKIELSGTFHPVETIEMGRTIGYDHLVETDPWSPVFYLARPFKYDEDGNAVKIRAGESRMTWEDADPTSKISIGLCLLALLFLFLRMLYAGYRKIQTAPKKGRCLMLVSLKVNEKARTKWQKFCKKLCKDKFYRSSMGRPYRKDMKFRRKHFNFIAKEYKPCGEEYVPDSRDTHGVYIDTFRLLEAYIPAITNMKVIESLVDWGCVDNASQAIDLYEEGKEKWPDRFEGNHIISLSPIWKATNPDFRWHKNGYYAGKANVNHEHFGDEEDEKLTMVYLYNVIRIG